MFEIRQLEEEDFPQYMELCKFMQQECDPEIPFDEQYLLVNMFRGIRDKDRKYINSYLCYRNKQLIGITVAAANPFYYSPALGVILHNWYVLPKYRYTRAGFQLLRASERWARRIGACRFYVGAERINDVELADRINMMVEKMGYKRFGHQYYKALNDGSTNNRSTT